MIKPVPKELEIEQNSEILEILKGQSCHGDIVLPIQKCLEKLNDVSSYCPDGKNFSYICWYVNNMIFAYATGMQKISFKLAQTGTLDLSKLKTHTSFVKCSTWYSVSYDSQELSKLVNSSYESAKNS